MFLLLFFFLRQIECSSIAEYSERIIKSNHLDSGKSRSPSSHPHLSDAANGVSLREERRGGSSKMEA